MQELNDAKTRLEAQATRAKNQLDIQEFVSDEGRIRESARNIDTYLGAVDKETVREMLRTLIREQKLEAMQVTQCQPLRCLQVYVTP